MSASVERVGPYLLADLVGSGGCGEVYRARHVYLGRRSAVKLLAPGDNQAALERFLDEARALANIHHPGLVQIFDFGPLPDGGAFLAMELLEGEPLSERIRRMGRLPAGELSDITRQLAEALEAVHDAGLVHRDLKPSNLFIVEERGRLRVKLLDFGIAKHLDDWRPRTQPGMLLGTPYYMSPEQCRGEPNIDRRSDVYALGALLFEMASGRPPFLGDNVPELIQAHLTQSPPPLAELAPELPAVVGEVAARALAKSPEARFPCALALAAALGPPSGDGELARSTDCMRPVAARSETRSYAQRPVIRPSRPRAPATVPMAMVAAPLPPSVKPTVVTTRVRSPLTARRIVGLLAMGALAVALGAWLWEQHQVDRLRVAQPPVVAAQPAAPPAPPDSKPAPHEARAQPPPTKPTPRRRPAARPVEPPASPPETPGLLNPF